MTLDDLVVLLTGFSPDGTIGLNLGANMYVGGVDSRVRVAPVLQLDTGFHGCVKQVCTSTFGFIYREIGIIARIQQLPNG